jgi:hypothetical protein
MSNFHPIDRATPLLLPPAVEGGLPRDHLTRRVIDTVDQVDLSALTQHGCSGSAAYHPAVVLCFLICD